MRPNMRGMETFDTSRPAVAAPAVSPTDTRATDPKAYAQASTIVPMALISGVTPRRIEEKT